MSKEYKLFCLIMDVRFELVNEVIELSLENLIPKDYWETEDEEIQISILKGLIEQSKNFVNDAKDGSK